MTNDEAAIKFKQIHELYSQVDSLRRGREAAEQAIIEEYKVKECNEKRAESAREFQDQIDLILFTIKGIEADLKNNFYGM